MAPVLAKDFVICGIDQDEMKNGMAVSNALTKGVRGGIPWFVIFAPSKPVIERGAEVDVYKRREAAVLATADGPNGNVGCPIAKEERAHFLACLLAARKNISDEELMDIAEKQRLFAANRNAEYGAAIDGMPAAAPTFAAIEASYNKKMEDFAVKWEAANNGEGEYPEFPNFKDDFNQFRSLAKNYLAKPQDRARSLQWCMQNFSQSGIRWKNPGKVLTGLSNSLIDNYLGVISVQELATTIARLSWERSFDAGEALKRLESKLPNQADRIEVAYHRAMMNKGMDDEQWMKDVDAFLETYPNTPRSQELKEMVAVIANLQVGKMAPALAGNSVDGAPIALSDYKGKVVFLVFWGFW